MIHLLGDIESMSPFQIIKDLYAIIYLNTTQGQKYRHVHIQISIFNFTEKIASMNSKINHI